MEDKELYYDVVSSHLFFKGIKKLNIYLGGLIGIGTLVIGAITGLGIWKISHIDEMAKREIEREISSIQVKKIAHEKIKYEIQEQITTFSEDINEKMRGINEELKKKVIAQATSLIEDRINYIVSRYMNKYNGGNNIIQEEVIEDINYVKFVIIIDSDEDPNTLELRFKSIVCGIPIGENLLGSISPYIITPKSNNKHYALAAAAKDSFSEAKELRDKLAAAGFRADSYIVRFDTKRDKQETRIEGDVMIPKC